MHRGQSIHDGHYVTYVRRGAVWALFDDDHTSCFSSLPAEVHTDGVVFFYKRLVDPDVPQLLAPGAPEVLAAAASNWGCGAIGSPTRFKACRRPGSYDARCHCHSKHLGSH